MWNRKLLDRENGGIFQLGPFPGESLLQWQMIQKAKSAETSEAGDS